MDRLALFGGKPVRTEPYPRHDTMIGQEEEREVLEVLRSGNLSGFSATLGERFLGGPKVRALEAAFAEKFGATYAVSTNSATSALHCAMAAIGIGRRDNVITSPFTMSATAAAIVSNGATPIFADIESNTYGLDPEIVARAITVSTKGILTVNLFGHPANLSELKALAKDAGVFLVEDNAQSPGATHDGLYAGTIGSIGIQSLNCHKCIQTGEGGVALTNDPDLAHRMRFARNHGEAVGADFLGGNHRMTEICAAIGLAQLRKLDYLTDVRRNLASNLSEALADFDFLELPRVSEGCTHVYYLYPLKFLGHVIGVTRHGFAKAMRAEGVSIDEVYTTPTHLLHFYRRRFGCFHGQCPVAEKMWSERLLTTDICKYPNTDREVTQFAEAVKKIMDNLGELKKHG